MLLLNHLSHLILLGLILYFFGSSACFPPGKPGKCCVSLLGDENPRHEVNYCKLL